MNIEETLGIDVGKNVFHAVGLNATGRVVLRRQLTRSALMRFMGKLAHCKVGMERVADVQERRWRGNVDRSARCGERHRGFLSVGDTLLGGGTGWAIKSTDGGATWTDSISGLSNLGYGAINGKE